VPESKSRAGRLNTTNVTLGIIASLATIVTTFGLVHAESSTPTAVIPAPVTTATNRTSLTTNVQPPLTPTTPASSVEPQTDPTIQLSQTSGPIGMLLFVSGAGFQPRETVALSFDDYSLGKVTANRQGGFSKMPVRIPAQGSDRQGALSAITAVGFSSFKSAFQTFEVTP
jgi:hypothetical protein